MSGMHYVADDYLIVSLDPVPRVFSLYSTAKLDPSQLGRFPELRASSEPGGAAEKSVLVLYPKFASQICTSLPLKAVALPSFAGRATTTFTRAATLDVIRAASFTTLSQLPHAGRQTHAFIERMAAAVPCFTAALGSDLTALAATVRAFIRRTPDELREMAAPSAASQTPARPLVSVVIPVHDGASFLGDVVRNVLDQRYPRLEIIVVDDGSTDDVAGALRGVATDVRLFRQENAGAASARNRGIRDAAGDLIAFLDVDDLWPAANLNLLVDYLLRNPDVDVVHGHAQPTRYTDPGEPGEYLGSPAEAFPYYIGAGLYRRQAFETVGLFDADLRFSEDADWYVRAADRGLNVHRLDAISLFVRRHGANMTRGKSLVELDQLRLFKKWLDRRRAENTDRNS